MNTYNSKILLFGEYSLLYHSMALTMPYTKYAGSWDFISNNSSEFAKQSNESLKPFAEFISKLESTNHQYEASLFNDELQKGLYFKSDIPQGFGLGSSGSLVAAFFSHYLEDKSYLTQLKTNLTNEKIQELRAELSALESFFHGTSSGIDPLSIVINKPLLLRNLNDISCIELPETNKTAENVVFLLDTGFERNTDGLVARFKQLYDESEFKEAIDKHLVPTVDTCIHNFLAGEAAIFYQNLQRLIEFQLKYMSFLIPQDLQEAVRKGLDSNDYFLKICGAGGGGYMLGFTKSWEQTKETLKDYNLELIYNY